MTRIILVDTRDFSRPHARLQHPAPVSLEERFRSRIFLRITLQIRLQRKSPLKVGYRRLFYYLFYTYAIL